MSLRTAIRIGALALPLLLGARPVSASPAFPDVVKGELGLANAPSCTVCHDTPAGGFGTATTAFSTYLRSRGLRAGDAASLRTALAAASGERHDSNGDGVADVDELKAGRDPSGVAADAQRPPEFGCGARVAPSSPRSSGVEIVLAVLTLGLVALRRRRA